MTSGESHEHVALSIHDSTPHETILTQKNQSPSNVSRRASSRTQDKTSEQQPTNTATEGWIIVVDNLHPEISEEDLTDFYCTYGDVQTVHVNLDRRTGYAKGYALLQFGTKEDADSAIAETNGVDFLGHNLEVAFAFHDADTSISQHRIRGSQQRSRSPTSRR